MKRERLTPVEKARHLRTLLHSRKLEHLMEAHSGLSAIIVEECGFEGIWASGLTVSASLGLRDSNEATWSQVLDVLEYMTDASRLPILVDGDSGHGNFNNVRRFVQKLCERGLAGVCIEDKLFPKTNSFLKEGQILADQEEFAGKIMAAKDSQTNPEFCVVARVEALVSGHGMGETLRRAERYVEAGADAVLIHSKKSTAIEVLQFMERWGDAAPVVVVPTKYYATPVNDYREARISTVIWANHTLRASIAAMRKIVSQIKHEQTVVGVEHAIAPLEAIFELVNQDELVAAEGQYLPPLRKKRDNRRTDRAPLPTSLSV